MTRFAVIFAIVAAVSAATIAAGHDSRGARRLAPGTPAASPGVCPTEIAAAPAASPTTATPLMTVGVVTIELTDQGFDPASFESAVGQDVQVTLHNRGSR
ncbi:MAG TPA: hypothetical protein VFI22_02145, partial [Thermomicrobiales bacterium]|nr:hypothetical protein [Thermomicrobiales bacterium]